MPIGRTQYGGCPLPAKKAAAVIAPAPPAPAVPTPTSRSLRSRLVEPPTAVKPKKRGRRIVEDDDADGGEEKALSKQEEDTVDIVGGDCGPAAVTEHAQTQMDSSLDAPVPSSPPATLGSAPPPNAPVVPLVLVAPSPKPGPKSAAAPSPKPAPAPPAPAPVSADLIRSVVESVESAESAPAVEVMTGLLLTSVPASENGPPSPDLVPSSSAGAGAPKAAVGAPVGGLPPVPASSSSSSSSVSPKKKPKTKKPPASFTTAATPVIDLMNDNDAPVKPADEPVPSVKPELLTVEELESKHALTFKIERFYASKHKSIRPADHNRRSTKDPISAMHYTFLHSALQHILPKAPQDKLKDFNAQLSESSFKMLLFPAKDATQIDQRLMKTGVLSDPCAPTDKKGDLDDDQTLFSSKKRCFYTVLVDHAGVRHIRYWGTKKAHGVGGYDAFAAIFDAADDRFSPKRKTATKPLKKKMRPSFDDAAWGAEDDSTEDEPEEEEEEEDEAPETEVSHEQKRVAAPAKPKVVDRGHLKRKANTLKKQLNLALAGASEHAANTFQKDLVVSVPSKAFSLSSSSVEMLDAQTRASIAQTQACAMRTIQQTLLGLMALFPAPPIPSASSSLPSASSLPALPPASGASLESVN